MSIEITGWFSTSENAEKIRKELAKWHGVRSAVINVDAIPLDQVALGSYSFTDSYQIGNYTGYIGYNPYEFESEGSGGVKLTINVDNDIAEDVRLYMLENGAIESDYFGD